MEKKVRSFMISTYGDSKWSKEKELNETMTIKQQPTDDFEKTLLNINKDFIRGTKNE